MKKLIYVLIAFFFLVSFSVNAQTGVKFGFKAGYSLATQYGITPADDNFSVETSNRNGFVGGIMIYYPITESVGIQQELLYAMKGSAQDVSFTVPFPINTVSEYKLNYFEMPMLVRYNFINIKSVGIYGHTGIALSLLMNGEYNIVSTVEPPGIPPVVTEESGDMAGLDIFDYSFLYGFGFDFGLFEKNFFFETRMTVGWNTLALPNVSGEDPVPLRNQDYIFTLGMYF
ncbi:MAG: porin family protein [Bacteroidales bacterium]|nr:porin family protein [Bacteroidales bacterium]